MAATKGYVAADATKIVTQKFWEDSLAKKTIGLYLHHDNKITKVIDTNDVLDGKEIYDLFPVGLSGDTLAFIPWFTDDSCGIYTTNLARN